MVTSDVPHLGALNVPTIAIGLPTMVVGNVAFDGVLDPITTSIGSQSEKTCFSPTWKLLERGMSIYGRFPLFF